MIEIDTAIELIIQRYETEFEDKYGFEIDLVELHEINLNQFLYEFGWVWDDECQMFRNTYTKETFFI